MKDRSRAAGERGFTLVELAIVLAVIGIAISGAMAGVQALRENNRLKETNLALRDVEHALTVYVMRRGRLPHAAAAGGDGTENGTSASGEVPYDALGLSAGDITDGWGNRLLYVVDTDLAGTDDLPCANGASLTDPTKEGALGLLDFTSTPANDATHAKVAYVSYSTGTNGIAEAPQSATLFWVEGDPGGGLFDDVVQGRSGRQILRDGGCRLVSELKGERSKGTDCPTSDAPPCGGGGGGGGEDPPPPPASGAGVLNRSNLQNSTGLEWGANGDTGYEEVRVNDTRIRAGNGRIASRESGGNDGLGTTGAGGGLSEDEYVDFIIDEPKQYYTVQLNSFANNTSAEIRAYRNGVQVGSAHTYSGSNATKDGVIYANRSFPDGSGGNLMFDTLRVIGTGKNSFFIYSMNFAE